MCETCETHWTEANPGLRWPWTPPPAQLTADQKRILELEAQIAASPAAGTAPGEATVPSAS